jgi:hypothetical protein
MRACSQGNDAAVEFLLQQGSAWPAVLSSGGPMFNWIAEGVRCAVAHGCTAVIPRFLQKLLPGCVFSSAQGAASDDEFFSARSSDDGQDSDDSSVLSDDGSPFEDTSAWH